MTAVESSIPELEKAYMTGRMLTVVSKQRGFIQGAFFASVLFLVISLVPFLLATLEHYNAIREGYEAAGFIWLFLGLPTTLLEILFEKQETFLVDQLVNLFLLGWLNFVALGAIIGKFSAKAEKRGKV
jgi:hypothetical protein